MFKSEDRTRMQGVSFQCAEVIKQNATNEAHLSYLGVYWHWFTEFLGAVSEAQEEVIVYYRFVSFALPW